MTDTLALSPDELLTTTRAVPRRLDSDRPVSLDVIQDCVRIASQAPSGSNRQGWHWLVVTDPDQRERIAELYRSAFEEYRRSATHDGGLFAAADNNLVQRRVSRSVEYLAHNMHRIPVMLIACVRAPGSAVLTDATQATMWGSLFPAVWSYILAARARGLGTAWTDLQLRYEREIAEIQHPGIRREPQQPTRPSQRRRRCRP
jgi:nitroreductase